MTAWPSGVTATLIADNCAPVGWRTADHALIYGSQNVNGYWDLYADSDHQSLTAPGHPLVWTHRGASDLQADLMLMTVARAQIPTAKPGQGGENDVVLMNLATGVVQALVTGRKGIFWARWNPARDRIVWSEQAAITPLPFGTQTIHVADVTATGIVNEIAYTSLPAGFYETYGWDASGHLLFASDAGTGNWLQTTFYTLPDHAAGVAALPAPVMAVSEYHEFAYVPPAGMFDDGIASLLVGWCNGVPPTALGLELWRVWLDGSGTTQRLTYFLPGWGLGVGAVAFDPTDPKRVAVAVKASQAGAYDGYLLAMP